MHWVPVAKDIASTIHNFNSTTFLRLHTSNWSNTYGFSLLWSLDVSLLCRANTRVLPNGCHSVYCPSLRGCLYSETRLGGTLRLTSDVTRDWYATTYNSVIKFVNLTNLNKYVKNISSKQSWRSTQCVVLCSQFPILGLSWCFIATRSNKIVFRSSVLGLAYSFETR